MYKSMSSLCSLSELPINSVRSMGKRKTGGRFRERERTSVSPYSNLASYWKSAVTLRRLQQLTSKASHLVCLVQSSTAHVEIHCKEAGDYTDSLTLTKV